MPSWAPSLMPSPRADWPPDSGLCVAILMVPLDWASAGPAPGSTRAAMARALSRWRNRRVFIRCPPPRGTSGLTGGAIIAGLRGRSTVGAGRGPGARRRHGVELASRLGIGRRDDQRLLQEGHGLDGAAGLALGLGDLEERRGIIVGEIREVWVLGPGAAEIRKRLGEAAGLCIQRSHVGERAREVGIELEGQAQHFLRLHVLALAMEGGGDVVGHGRAFGPEPERPPVGLLRLGMPLLGRQRRPEIVPAPRALAIDGHGPAPQRLGVLPRSEE